MENKREFDEFAQDYRKILDNNLNKLSSAKNEYFCEYKIKEVFNQLKKLPNKILDFGCGDGKSCEFFKKYFTSSELFGVDVSSESIKIAKSKNIPNCKFFLYEGENLPFEDNSFDLVFAACVFHHIPPQNRKKAVEEIKRILKNNGKLFIFEHNPLNPFTLKMVKDCVFDKDAELIFASDMQKMVKRIGFNKAKINFTLFFPRFKIFSKLFKYEKHLKKLPVGAQYYLSAIKD